MSICDAAAAWITKTYGRNFDVGLAYSECDVPRFLSFFLNMSRVGCELYSGDSYSPHNLTSALSDLGYGPDTVDAQMADQIRRSYPWELVEALLAERGIYGVEAP